MKRNLSKFLPLGVIGIVVMLFLTSCDPEHDHEIPSLVIKNNTNQTIHLQFYGELFIDEVDQLFGRRGNTLDTHNIIIEPQKLHFFAKGGLRREICGSTCNYVYYQKDHSFVLSADTKGACFMIVDNNDQEKILKKWTPDYDSNSLFKEFYRLSDWKFLENEGVRDNDAYVFEINDSDLISE
jgi:hypothetical protein